MSESPPESAANKPPSGAPAEPIGAEVHAPVPKPVRPSGRLRRLPVRPSRRPPMDLRVPAFIVGAAGRRS